MPRGIRDELEKIYPPIVWRQTLYVKDEKTCIRIEIEHSGETPHFRDMIGHETVRPHLDPGLARLLGQQISIDFLVAVLKKDSHAV